MTPRTFVVTVSDSPDRVVVEDVRTQRREVAEGLDDVGTRIAHWLESADQDATPRDRATERRP
jgi:hypothetical protein